MDGIGVPVTTNYDIWKNNPEKVFGVAEQWDAKYPNTHIAVIKALIRAGKWLDEKDAGGKLFNRDEETAQKVYKPAIYQKAAAILVSEGTVDAKAFAKSDVAKTLQDHLSRQPFAYVCWLADQPRCGMDGIDRR